jgi:hypothetical protein
LCGCEPTLIISLEVFYLKLKLLWSHLHSRWFIKRLPYNKIIARLGYISMSDYYLKTCEN